MCRTRETIQPARLTNSYPRRTGVTKDLFCRKTRPRSSSEPNLAGEETGWLARVRVSAVLPFVVLAVSLASTGVWYYILQNQGEERARLDFESEARQATSALREEMLGFEEVIQAGAGLISASESVSREEWQRFVDRLELPNAYPAIETINYAERVPLSGVSKVEQRMRGAGYAEFSVWPEGSRDEYIINTLIEPSGA